MIYYKYKRYRNITQICFAVFAITFMLMGCGNDETAIPDYDMIDVENGETIKVKRDSIMMFNTETCVPAYTHIVNPDDTECIKRFIAFSEDGMWVRAKFSDLSWIGLNKDEMYYVLAKTYYHIIPDKRDCVAIPYALQHTNMGLLTRCDGTWRIGYMQNGGRYLIKGKEVNCHTVLLYIGYDSKGNRIGKYFPCSPNDLEWNYSWLNLNDIL